MKMSKLLGLACLIVVIVAGGFVAFAWRSEMPLADESMTVEFQPERVAQGAELARIGDCAVCHTAPGGKLFAGGLPIETPFGTIYSTNITPDRETGIGGWTEAAFIRAMREGVDREGHHLYPAFPFDHFTKVTDDDDKALFAFLMSRTPIQASPPPNQLPFPLNVRLVLAGWKALFLREGPYQNDPAHDASWNRGAYLVEGLGHCSACHSPRNALGAEKDGADRYAGGTADGWTAYALNGDSPAPVRWTVDSLADYLKHGWQVQHGISRGPMAAVTANLGNVPDDDIRAMATYVAAQMGTQAPEKDAGERTVLKDADPHVPGATPAVAGSQTLPVTRAGAALGAGIYAAACSSCHDAGRPPPFGGIKLDLSSAMNGPDPTNPIHVILHGLPAAEGEASAIMPGFAASLNDDQIAALLDYLRATFSDKPAWPDPRGMVAKLRAADAASPGFAADGVSSAPANPTRHVTTW